MATAHERPCLIFLAVLVLCCPLLWDEYQFKKVSVEETLLGKVTPFYGEKYVMMTRKS